MQTFDSFSEVKAGGRGDWRSPLSDETVCSVVRAISDRVGTPLTLLLVGSFALGFATPTSDVDLLAVVEHLPDDSDRLYITYAIDGLRGDVECVTTRAFLERTVFVLDLDQASFNRLPPRQIELCHRALFGKRLFGTEVGSYLIAPGTANRLALRLAHRNVAYMPEAYSDLRGAHLSGDHDSMCYLVRQLAELSVDAILNIRHTCISKAKWRQRLLTEAFARGVLDTEVNELLFPALSGNKAEAEALARRVVLLSRLAQSQLYEDIGEVDEALASELVRRRLRPATWACCFPLPGLDKFLLEVQGKNYQVSPDIAMAFYAMACRDIRRTSPDTDLDHRELPAVRGRHIELLARIGALELIPEAA